MIKWLNGTITKLPNLIECDNIPQEKQKIPTPSMANLFPHLHDIAKEIPLFDKDANIVLLLGRDALELLKVREFRNGPTGAPWAQRLLLGWTISGQHVSIVRPGSPEHISTYRTVVEKEQPGNTISIYPDDVSSNEVPCPNYFKVKENKKTHFTEKENRSDVYHITPEDNDTALRR